MTPLNSGKVVQQVLRVLEAGEASAVDIAAQTGLFRYRVHNVLYRMVKPSKAGIRRIHVARWTYEGKGFRKYLRPIYALGDKPNAPKETNATSLSNS